ncbi:MAG TPA: formimidoylglutamate deiminase [Myxococcaceae bacterium]|jgi:formimidoylglutamate deiminase|nr:formimidoylglutamate deiminase [Myxococcaceae bacterium]
MAPTRWLFPDAVLWDGALLESVAVEVSPAGELLSAGKPPPGAPVERLPRRLLLPGLVDVHSHAFQRTLRGRTQARSPDVEVDDFWTWREVMYQAALQLDPEGVYLASRQCFLEMALAGVTAVGEFHYLHHQPDGRPYADPLELGLQVIRAAREVGLRIVLLRAGYHRPGYRAPENPRQRRFYDATPEAWLRAAADLRTRTAADPLVTVGLAPHSVRAVSRPWLEEAARARAWLVHMHVAEQPEEVVVCQAEYDRRPVELLAELGLITPAFTAVHAVHTLPHERELLRGASVCACPTTERDLGDGILAADGMLRAGARLCIGTDSQTTLDLFDELRAMEGSLRLTRGRRAVLDAPEGPDGLGRLLLSFASENGARALGLGSGALRPGAPADLVTVDLDHPSLAGAPREALVASVVFGAPAAAIRDVAVQGRWVVRDGRHPLAEASGQAYAELCRRVFGR